MQYQQNKCLRNQQKKKHKDFFVIFSWNLVKWYQVQIVNDLTETKCFGKNWICFKSKGARKSIMEGRSNNPKIDTGELTLKRRTKKIFVQGLSDTPRDSMAFELTLKTSAKLKSYVWLTMISAIIYIEDLVLTHSTTKKTP